MDKQKLEDRIKQLEQERDMTRANLIAYEGAIQDCKYWLTQLDQPKEEEKNEQINTN